MGYALLIPGDIGRNLRLRKGERWEGAVDPYARQYGTSLMEDEDEVEAVLALGGTVWSTWIHW